MANLNAPSGMVPVMYRNGNAWNGQGRLYYIAATDTNAFYPGDPVKLSGSADANGVQGITIGTAGASVRGIVIALGLGIPYGYQGGPLFNPNDLTKVYRPSGANANAFYAFVVDDPDVIYEVQEAASATPIQAANMGKNANFVAAAPATGVVVSGYTLDGSTVNTTSTLNLKILQSVQRPDNTPYTQYQRFLVLLNNHDFSSGTAGV